MRVLAAVCAALAMQVVLAVPGWSQAGPGTVPGTGRITGVVTAPGGVPLQTAGITLRAAADSAVVTGALTDAAGRFRLEGLASGRYLLRVSLLGYRPRNSEVIEITPQAPTVDLGVIELEESALELDAIAVDAEREAVVVEADRTTYNTRSMPVAGTGTAVDVLRSVPELEVDVSNNVRLRGNQPVAVHINGRPAPLQGDQLGNFLQQLPGNRIDRVEVMPNPSARHDPEGMGGIVNIVLRDDLDLGLSGSTTLSVSDQNRRFLNGRLNYQRGRLTLFTGAGVNMMEMYLSNHDQRRNLVADPVTTVEQSGRTQTDSWGVNLDWTAELRVGAQATLWSNAWMFRSANDSDETADFAVLTGASEYLERYSSDNARDFIWGNYNVGGGFKQIFERQKEELTIDGRITKGGNSNGLVQARLYQVVAGADVTQPPQLILNDIDSGNGSMSVQADYFRPLGPGRLDVGYRSFLRLQDNDNVLREFESADHVDPRSSTQSGYDYDELFHSLYATVGRPMGRFNVLAGLRAERTTTSFESLVTDAAFDRSYSSLFPSLTVSYSPKPGRTARALYSRRIGRPPPFYLDPYVPTTDPLNVSVGNPDLRPSYTDSYSMDLSVTGARGTLRLAPYYRRTSDVWERIRTVNADGVATNRWENAQQSRALGTNITVSAPASGRVSGSASLNVYRDTRDGTNIDDAYRRSAVIMSMSGNTAIKLTETLTAQAFANHFPAQSILQGRATGYTFSSVTVRQRLWGTRGNVSLSIMDPLNLTQYRSNSSDATYTQSSRTSMRSRVASLGLTYNFGRPPQQQSRRSGQEEAGETIRVQ